MTINFKIQRPDRLAEEIVMTTRDSKPDELWICYYEGIGWHGLEFLQEALKPTISIKDEDSLIALVWNIYSRTIDSRKNEALYGEAA